jgi:hypothetical protein
MVPQERCVSILVQRINIGEARVIREEETDVFLIFDRLVDDVLVQKFLGLDLVGRVAFNEFRKFHFEDPVDVQIVKNYVEDVSLRTLSVIQQVMQKL